MLTCVHHISWIRPVDGGLHQCILCQQVVTRKDVYPKLEDLTEELRRRWDEHEARGAAVVVAAPSERADGPTRAGVAPPNAASSAPADGGAKPAAVAAPREPAGPRANDPAAPGAAAPARDLGE